MHIAGVAECIGSCGDEPRVWGVDGMEEWFCATELIKCNMYVCSFYMF